MNRSLLCGLLLAAAGPTYAQKIPLHNSSTSNLRFVSNAGQVRDQYQQPRADIDVRIDGSGTNLFVGAAALHYQWAWPIGTKIINEDTLQELAAYRMDVRLLGTNPNTTLVKERPTPFFERYYTPAFGPDGGLAPSYERITYQDIYPNIDWTLYVKDDKVEYDFVVRPGGRVSDIKLQYSGASALGINKDGSLHVTTPFGSVTEAAPFSFQQADGKTIASSFTLAGDILSFEVADHQGTLVIDPVLEWSTYYGGSFDESIPVGCVAADAFGNAYFTGHTTSTQNIATTGSHQDTLALNNDAFVAKFNSSGQRLWATYYGGLNGETSAAVATDRSGNVYLAGQTNSHETGNPNFVTPGAHQTLIGGGFSHDAFLVKFDSSGLRQWCTYYGGTGADLAFGLACDTADNIIMSGLTASTSGIATAGAHQESRSGGNDAFVVKFDPQGQRLWGTYFGGSSAELTPAVITDDSSNVIIAGGTQSTNNIAGPNAYQSARLGSRDAFIAKFNSAGGYQWSSYLGDIGNERVSSLACDSAHNIYIFGDVNNVASVSQITTPGSAHPNYIGGGSDAFLVKFDGHGDRIWGTFLGGSGNEIAAQVKYADDGVLYLTGSTNSTDSIATASGFQSGQNGTLNAFIEKYTLDGQKLWGSYFGGESQESGLGIAFSNNATLFFGGSSRSATGVATANAHQATHGGSMSDGFLALINDCDLENNSSISGADTVCQGLVYSYSTAAVPGAQSYQWILPAGWQGNSSTNDIEIIAHGADDAIGMAIVYACGLSDTVYRNIIVIPLPELSPAAAVGLCAGDTLLISAPAADDHQWLQNGQLLAGATQQALSVHDAGSYQVVSTNVLGCADTSLPTVVSLNPLPEPVITANGNTLSTDVFASYQWQHNGVDIVGATQQDHTYSINSGTYTVAVTDTNGCSAVSLPFTAGVGIRPSALELGSIKIYPNPVTDILHIESKEALQLQLSSMDGRVLLQSTASVLDLSVLDAGMYLLYCYDADGGFIGVHKVVKR